jgi:hypothetical protein
MMQHSHHVEKYHNRCLSAIVVPSSDVMHDHTIIRIVVIVIILGDKRSIETEEEEEHHEKDDAED